MANILNKTFVGEPMISVSCDEVTKVRNIYITLNDIIINTELMTTLLFILDNVSEDDTVLINLGSYGGNVQTCISIITAIKNCKATVNGVVNGIAASSCAIIAAYCDKLDMGDYGLLMYHGPSTFMMGKVADIMESSDAIIKIVKQITKPAVDKHILTEEDFSNIFENKCDVYITKQDLKERGVL